MKSSASSVCFGVGNDVSPADGDFLIEEESEASGAMFMVVRENYAQRETEPG